MGGVSAPGFFEEGNDTPRTISVVLTGTAQNNAGKITAIHRTETGMSHDFGCRWGHA
ncbi:MAG: hypothetical protein R8G34_17080 [Paracoccaceae bacterium]|nr:hypothetical protein [Paracoccaceae bacterium]